jgi:hypothetical protein
MLGLTNIDKNEAIVVRTTMASQQLGISPDAMLREIAYSHSRCFGKGERKFRFKVEGGYQQANCLGVYLCCLPATLKQELKTLLEGTCTVHLQDIPIYVVFFSNSSSPTACPCSGSLRY